MKKSFLVMMLAIAGIWSASAQVDGNAIGVRLGWGGDISYQHALGNSNRLELDLKLSLGDNLLDMGLVGIYHWVFDLSDLAKGFNWYVGPGASASFWSYKDANVKSAFALGVVGQIGIEYNFDIPLQLSLDYRPIFYVLPSTGGGWSDICLGVRYKF